MPKVNNETFTLETEYIQLNQLLKLLNWCESGGMANTVISEGLVSLNGQTVLEKRKKIRPGDVVEFNGLKVVVE